MDNTKNNLIVVNLSQVKLPTFTESRYLDWIKYGDDNEFPNKLQDLANRSALHNAIISSKISNTCGEGFKTDGEIDKNTQLFIDNPNPDEDLETLYNKIVNDYVLYGGYALNVIWSRDRKSISEVYHIDFAKIRCMKQNDKNKITTYLYSKDWSNYRKAENTPLEIPAFDIKTKEPSQLIYVKQYRPGFDYYPVPSYVGALSYIEIDTEIANFHLSHIKNGMTPNIILNFNNGIPSDDERKTIEKQINQKYTGTDNAGKFILTFSEDKDKAPTVTTLSPSQLDKQFIALEASVLQNILSGHKIISPMLVGIKTEGQLGGGNELDNAFTLFQNSVIKPLQKNTLNVINKICKINGLQELNIIPVAPLEFSWSENVLQTIMTINEMREKIGLDPMEVKDIAPDTQTNQ